MTNLAENWVSGCTQLEDAVDDNGNTLYYDTKPLPGGDMTYGVYTDTSCTIESSLTWSDVLSASDADNNGSNDKDGMPSIDSLDRWNSLLSDWKICQPCRAYNRVRTSDGSSHSSGGSDGSEDSGDYEDGDDGEGGKDRWGFDCYDDAGYQNCNQCYKFQTQTDMEAASNYDLERATAQGTILGIHVDGTRYGKGNYVAPGRGLRVVKRTSTVLMSTMALVGLGYYYYGKKLRRVGKVGNDDHLEDNLNDNGWQSTSDNRESADWKCYIKTAHSRICSGLKSLMPAMPTKATTTTREATSPTKADRKKKFLVAQLKKKDAKLAEQEQLIQQLQQKLAHYEFKDNITGPVLDTEQQQGVDTIEKMTQEQKKLAEEASTRVSASNTSHNSQDNSFNTALV